MGRVSSSRKLRVVRVMPVLDFGGVESRVTLQARLHDRDRFNLRVCAFHHLGTAARTVEEAGVPVDHLETEPAVRNPKAPLALLRYLRSTRPHIVHASIAEANVHTLVAARLAGVQRVIVEEVGQPEHSRAGTMAFRFLYRRADAIIGVTQSVCDHLVAVDGAPPDRVKLVYNCAGGEYFPERRQQPRERRRGDPFRVLLVGRLHEVKNHSTFLDGFARFARAHGDVRLQIAGEGKLRREIEQQIESLGLDARVQMLGYRSDVSNLLAESSVFALPSWSEGCSISLIEAMASGLPVIASRVPGNREVLGPLASEWTAPPGDAAAWATLLERVYSLSPSDYREVGYRGQQNAYARFAPSVYVKALEDLYATLGD